MARERTKMNRKGFSKTGLALVIGMVVCLILALAVGIPNGLFGGNNKAKELNDGNTPSVKELKDGNPILIFDKRDCAKALLQAYDNDQVVSVTVLYDQMGGNEPYESDDPTVITNIYKNLKNIVVGDETGESLTDSYHFVDFAFSEDSTGKLTPADEDGRYHCVWNFEGQNLLCWDPANRQISNSDGLFDSMAKLCEAK